MYGIITEGGTCVCSSNGRRGHLCHCTVRACFESHCASRGGPCDSVALVLSDPCRQGPYI